MGGPLDGPFIQAGSGRAGQRVHYTGRKNTPVDVRTGDATPKAYEDYIKKMVKNFDKRGYLPAERF